MATKSDPTARILTHMNKDHQLALYDYLHYYAKVDLDADHPQTSVELISMDLDNLVLEYTSPDRNLPTKSLVPIDPPMQDWSEARTTLVRMAHEAAASRGYAAHRITTYEPPSSVLSWTVIIGTIANIPAIRARILEQLPDYVAESGFFQSLNKYPWAFVGTLAVAHLVEAVFLMRPKLNKWRVPMPQKAYWLASSFAEGFPAMRRFNAIAKKFEH